LIADRIEERKKCEKIVQKDSKHDLTLLPEAGAQARAKSKPGLLGQAGPSTSLRVMTLF
jgi:hypothetical protein